MPEKTKESVRSEITAIEADIASLESQKSALFSRKQDLIYRQKISPPRVAEDLQEEILHIDMKVNELDSRIDQNKKRINRLFTEMTVLSKQ